jgi:hypothetical protein
MTDDNAIAIAAPPNPMALIDAAIAKGIDADQLGKLMDLQERWEKRRAEERFAEALAGFQAECPDVFKKRTAKVPTKSGGEWSYRFESFDDVMSAAGPVLAKFGISVGFDTDHNTEKNIIKLKVRVRVGSHFEDHHFQMPVPADLKVSDPQSYGIALSYAKRYGLKAALNIVSTDDPDTDAAGLFEFIDASEAAALKELIIDKGADLDRFLKWAGCDSLEKLPRKQLAKATDMLRRKAKAGAA